MFMYAANREKIFVFPFISWMLTNSHIKDVKDLLFLVTQCKIVLTKEGRIINRCCLLRIYTYVDV